MPLSALGPTDVVRFIETFADALRANQEALNRLNVYPVPDGDTGTNMALTMRSVVVELQNVDSTDMMAVCKAFSKGAIMGARGNSGVILSQILKGISATWRGLEKVGPADVVNGLRVASDGAYGAVGRPVEGTILTVARRAAEAAEAAAPTGADGAARPTGPAEAAGPGDLLAVLEGAATGAALGLASTPELLPVLKQAGVVDAGGAGYTLLLGALLNVVDGRAIAEIGAPESPGFSGAQAPIDLYRANGAREPGSGRTGDTMGEKGVTGEKGEKGVADLRYEVMYLLHAPDASIPGFKDAWAAIGDSIVVVGEDGLWNCHIHTDDIGASIEAAIDIGRPRQIRVTDLLEQVEEERWVREATGEALVVEPPNLHTPCATAVVAVATGAGIRRIFLSLGVQQIVTGGQSMNPSTAQLLDAVEACPADAVVILPNNKNIIAVAEQVAALTTKRVEVVATRSIAEGLACALQYDPGGHVVDNAKMMRVAAAHVASGEVTRAVRDSACDVGPIKAGDYLGIARDDGIVAVASTLADAATTLLARLVEADHEIVTLIEGEGSSVADTRRITEWLADNRADVTVETHHGGQPLYPYLVAVE